MHRDFDAAAREAVGEPLTFTLGGEIFTCTPRLAALPMLQLAASAEKEGAEAAVAFYAFLQSMLVVTDVVRFETMMLRERVDMDLLKEVTSWVIAEMTGRPTRRPSDSAERPLLSSLPLTDDSSPQVIPEVSSA